MSGRDPLVGPVRSEPGQQHQPGLLPRLPALLLDDRVDHVRGAARAGAALGLSGPRRAARLGGLDPRRRLGLELRRLADAAVRLPRLDRVRGRARRLGRVHARRPVQPRAADRQVHEGGPDPHLQTPQHPHDPDGADADLHRVLRLLRRLPGDRLDHRPGLGEHLPQPDHAGLDRDDHHLRLRRRLHRRLLRQPRRPVLDRFRRPRGGDQRFGGRGRLRADARLPDRGRDRGPDGLGRELDRDQDARRRRRRRGLGARIRRLHGDHLGRRLRRRLPDRGQQRRELDRRPADGSRHLRAARLPERLGGLVDPEEAQPAAGAARGRGRRPRQRRVRGTTSTCPSTPMPRI